MKDIDDTRRTNLRTIEREAGGTSEAAKLIGMSPAQFINLRDGAKDSKTGKPRGMRKETARRIESACGKPAGWLDAEHMGTLEEILSSSSSPVIPLPSAAQRGLSGVLTELQTVIDGLPPLLQDAARVVLSKWLHGQASQAAVVATIEGMRQIDTGSDPGVENRAA